MKNPQLPIKEKSKRFGQLCLVIAIIINGVLLLINIRQTSLEDQLSRKRSAENYFILNQQAINDEKAKRVSLHASLNQMKVLRRLSRDKLSEKENETLLSEEREAQKQIDASFVRIVGATYLQANDPPAVSHPDKMFSNKSDTELEGLLITFEEQAFQYAKTIKDEVVNLMGRIAFWKVWHSLGLAISMFILVIGNILLFISDASRDPQA